MSRADAASTKCQLLIASVAKAIAVDEIAAGAAASSCAEDAFFVAQHCAKRALATGHAGAASAVINHVGNTLGVDLLEELVRKVRLLGCHPTTLLDVGS